MALTGLDIFKLLPKTNCGDCGVPTCLAFAMKLAQRKAQLNECPHASEQAQQVLGAASEPPMRQIKLGVGADAFEIGGETEMYRHEKTFCRQTAIAVRVSDQDEPTQIAKIVAEADSFVIERVGEPLRINAFCLTNASGDRARFLAALAAVTGASSKAVILDSADPETLQAALAALEGRRPVIRPGAADASAFVEIAKEGNAALIVSADSFDGLAAQVEKIAQAGFRDLILELRSPTPGAALRNETALRRAALRKRVKTFGYPLARFLPAQDDHELAAAAAVGICKYAGLLVLPRFSREMLLALFTLRQNIYTDPQKPIQVDPKLYAIGDPQPESWVFVTTNFSLTYFIVSGEIENAGVSAWLVVPDCEGMSVLTAWAAGKFTGQKVGQTVKAYKLEEHVKTREIIIPGYASAISGELEEALPGWKVTVGPQEAADIGPFVASRKG